MVFPVVMYGCESWTIKKIQCQIIDTFELWCWRRLLRVPLTARRSNQSILKKISSEYSLKGLLLKLKLCLATWSGELTHWKRPCYWERLKAEGEGGHRDWDVWMASPTWWTWVWASSGSWWWTGKPGVLQSVGSPRVRHDWATELKSALERMKISVNWEDVLKSFVRLKARVWCLHKGDEADKSDIYLNSYKAMKLWSRKRGK